MNLKRTYYLRAKLVGWVAREAKRRGVPHSVIVERALHHYANLVKAGEIDPRTRSKGTLKTKGEAGE